MSVALTSIKGVSFYNFQKAYPGVTLLVPVNGTGVWMIDMLGRYVNYWDMGYKAGYHAELLPNGHLLYAGQADSGPLADLEGAGGILLEVDWEGGVVWKYEDLYLHHTFNRMSNGNTLVLKWVKVPDDIAAKVKGGDPGIEKNGVMWGDIVQEITPTGDLAWEWIAHEHLDPEGDMTCAICPRSTWTHANAVVELPNGDILISFMKNNTVVIIDKRTGGIKWRWGQHIMAHQHCPSVLDNGNILIFDNHLHPIEISMGYSRVMEVDPEINEIVWCYGGGDELHYFYSSTMSSCQRLPNGNTFICESSWGRLFEVTASGEIVWEYINNLPSQETSLITSKSYPVYCAYRYGVDYSGLKRPLPMPEEKQPAPGTVKKKEEAFVKRLTRLGY
jgi:hypothetical protein